MHIELECAYKLAQIRTAIITFFVLVKKATVVVSCNLIIMGFITLTETLQRLLIYPTLKQYKCQANMWLTIVLGLYGIWLMLGTGICLRE